MEITIDITIGDEIFHPCNVDIIKHKVISIRQYEGFRQYVLKAVNNVGACGKIELIIDEHNGNLRFVELLNEENIEYASGLGDFVEGNYYRTLDEAKLEFYKQQEILAWSNMTHKERLFKEASARYEQIKLIVKTLKSN